MVTRVGVTRREFYEVFDNVEECYLAAFDRGLERISRSIAQALEGDQHWLYRVRAALSAVLVFLDDDWRCARLLFSEAPTAQQKVFQRRRDALDLLAGLLDEHAPREQHGAEGLTPPPARLTADLLIGGSFSVLQARILGDQREPLISLAPPLTCFIVTPYLGEVAASIEFGRVDGTRHDQRPRSGRPGVRTTYRTSRVLHAISATPHLSNREIADAAGLSDEGQTSKLLARLERRGVIENVGLGAAHGEPNAWLLTAYGQRLVKAIGPGFAVSPTVQGSRRLRGVA